MKEVIFLQNNIICKLIQFAVGGSDDDMDVIEGNGFLNMAMHTLVQDRQKPSVGVPINEERPLTATAGKYFI